MSRSFEPLQFGCVVPCCLTAFFVVSCFLQPRRWLPWIFKTTMSSHSKVGGHSVRKEFVLPRQISGLLMVRVLSLPWCPSIWLSAFVFVVCLEVLLDEFFVWNSFSILLRIAAAALSTATVIEDLILSAAARMVLLILLKSGWDIVDLFSFACRAFPTTGHLLNARRCRQCSRVRTFGTRCIGDRQYYIWYKG